MKAKLSLIGAGPGDPELLTIKALKALSQADYILYDSLVNPKIFDLLMTKPNLIFVGKRKGESQKQEEINKLIKDLLEAGYNIARLKGGDPLIFARALEEIAIAKSLNIPVEIIPGLSSGLAAASLHQFSLTSRENIDTLIIATGHVINEKKLEYWKQSLMQNSKLIIYMGLANIVEIVKYLQSNCQEALQVTAISNVSLDGEKFVQADLDNIVQKLIDLNIQSPVIFIINKLEKFSTQFIKSNFQELWN